MITTAFQKKPVILLKMFKMKVDMSRTKEFGPRRLEEWLQNAKCCLDDVKEVLSRPVHLVEYLERSYSPNTGPKAILPDSQDVRKSIRNILTRISGHLPALLSCTKIGQMEKSTMFVWRSLPSLGFVYTPPAVLSQLAIFPHQCSLFFSHDSCCQDLRLAWASF